MERVKHHRCPWSINKTGAVKLVSRQWIPMDMLESVTINVYEVQKGDCHDMTSVKNSKCRCRAALSNQDDQAIRPKCEMKLSIKKWLWVKGKTRSRSNVVLAGQEINLQTCMLKTNPLGCGNDHPALIPLQCVYRGSAVGRCAKGNALVGQVISTGRQKVAFLNGVATKFHGAFSSP